MGNRIVLIAIVCHQANKAWCEQNGDTSQKDWFDAEEWQKKDALFCAVVDSLKDKDVATIERALENLDNPDVAARALTLGEKRVGVTFNPSSISLVGTIKKEAADAIDACKEGAPTYLADGLIGTCQTQAEATTDNKEAQRCYLLAEKFFGFVAQNIAESHFDYAQENLETGVFSNQNQ